VTHRIHLIAERLWAVIALVALAVAIYDLITHGWAGGKISLIFPGIAGTWYLTRRALRKKIEASAESRPPSDSESH